jgi:hypothetical protein
LAERRMPSRGIAFAQAAAVQCIKMRASEGNELQRWKRLPAGKLRELMAVLRNVMPKAARIFRTSPQAPRPLKRPLK